MRVQVMRGGANGNAPAGERKRAYLQTMGCQMNVSDSEVWKNAVQLARKLLPAGLPSRAPEHRCWMWPQVVLSILRDAGYDQTSVMTDADVVLVNTCAIREGACCLS
jgi:Uncharacterized protein family UPF0004